MNSSIDKKEAEQFDVDFISKLKSISNIISILLIIIGFIVLLGWAFDIIFFKTPAIGLPIIKSNTALGFILLGLSLWFLQEKRLNNRNLLLGRFFALLAAIIGFLTLVQYAFDINLGIDQLLFVESAVETGTYPNRMSFIAALSLFLAGVALSLFDTETKNLKLSQILTVILGLATFLTIIGYLYQSTIYSIYLSIVPSPYGASGFVLIFFGIIFARPDMGYMKLVTSDSLGSQLARTLLPFLIITPLVVGYLSSSGEEIGLYDAQFETALVIFTSILILLIVFLVSVNSINITETKRKKTEKKLELAYKYNRSLIEASVDPFVTISPQGIITDANKAVEFVTGYSKDKLIGTDFSSYFTDPPKAKRGYVSVFNKGRVFDYPLEIKHKDGHMTPVLYNASVYRDEYGDVIGVFAAARDITSLKRAEQNLKNIVMELERSNEELEKFAYVASHDLQEPLRMIVSYLQLFERRYKDKIDEKGQKYMFYAVDGAKRMQGLINDLLTYSRVTTHAEEFKEVNFEEILNETLMNLEYSIKKSNATITNDPLPNINADAGQMGQLFQNLIANAIKFRKKDEAPKVHISSQKKDNEYIFSVSDNGIGIDEKYGDRIFELFQRLQKRSEYEGTGLGLAISKKIVERHNGKIWFKSEENIGTTFYFSIPVNLK
ncbi:PAS domain-containing sensor histidine kinase [Methanobacterium sp. ACI-7]|uniref:PAS domain-containing sensor histidine kinase n=1 Tax=unclassified Methanobacterium TaxID=2627676 RepID=UPI0039C2F91C